MLNCNDSETIGTSFVTYKFFNKLYILLMVTTINISDYSFLICINDYVERYSVSNTLFLQMCEWGTSHTLRIDIGGHRNSHT